MNESLNEAIANEIIHELDNYARDCDPYDYGLPISDEAMSKMRQIVATALEGVLVGENSPIDSIIATMRQQLAGYSQIDPHVVMNILYQFKGEGNEAGLQPVPDKNASSLTNHTLIDCIRLDEAILYADANKFDQRGGKEWVQLVIQKYLSSCWISGDDMQRVARAIYHADVTHHPYAPEYVEEIFKAFLDRYMELAKAAVSAIPLKRESVAARKLVWQPSGEVDILADKEIAEIKILGSHSGKQARYGIRYDKYTHTWQVCFWCGNIGMWCDYRLPTIEAAKGAAQEHYNSIVRENSNSIEGGS